MFKSILKWEDPQPAIPAFKGFVEVLKYNQNHDPKNGQFTSGDSTESVAGELRKDYQHVPTEDEVMHGFDSKTRSVVEHYKKEITEAVARGEETVNLHSTKDANGRRVYSDERKALHQAILADIFNSKKVAAAQSEHPTAYFLGGRGGSGKSQLNKALNADTGVYGPKNTIVLDPDELKERLGLKAVGGDGGYKGWNAFLYHEESSYLMDKALAYARRHKLNVAIDQTMRANPKDKIVAFKKAGFRTEGHYMFLPEGDASRRAVGRFKGTGDFGGRFVPPSVVLGNTENEKNFDRNLNRFDDWTVTRNDVKMGQAPIRVASKATHGGAK